MWFSIHYTSVVSTQSNTHITELCLGGASYHSDRLAWYHNPSLLTTTTTTLTHLPDKIAVSGVKCFSWILVRSQIDETMCVHLA